MAFEDLTHKELIRAAEEDFAFELLEEEKKTKAKTLAAYKEAGLKFSDYLMANPDKAEEFAEKVEEQTIASIRSDAKVTGEKPVRREDIVVKEATPVTAPWLIKMTRENPLFEVGKYRFTESHPYVLVEAEDVDYVIAQDGFRQATPNELAEYYG